jgi:hypothetical protein
MNVVLGDSLTVGIVLTLIFGAVCFYLYSRMGQNEKRVGLLENLLLSLKMSTEASLFGPDMVEPTSSPAPLAASDVEDVSEENYAEMLKGIAPNDNEALNPPPCLLRSRSPLPLRRRRPRSSFALSSPARWTPTTSP